MAAYDIDCVDCGAPHRVARKDAKYCPSCSTLSKLSYLRGKYKRPRVCRTCAEKFRPCQQLDLAYCGDCETRQRGDTTPGTACRFCANEVHAKSPLPTICRSCLKNPGQQDNIVRMLLKGLDQRTAKYGAVLAAQKTGTPHIRKVT